MARGSTTGHNLFIVSLHCGCLKEEIDKTSLALHVRTVTWLKKILPDFHLPENKFHSLWKQFNSVTFSSWLINFFLGISCNSTQKIQARSFLLVGLCFKNFKNTFFENPTNAFQMLAVSHTLNFRPTSTLTVGLKINFGSTITLLGVCGQYNFF